MIFDYLNVELHILTKFSFLCQITYVYLYNSNIVNCIWESWSSWSTCSITCGTGTQFRIRRIQSHEENGGTCTGDVTEVSQVNCGTCPAGKKLTISTQSHEDC